MKRCDVCWERSQYTHRYTQMNGEIVSVCGLCLKVLSENKADIFRMMKRNAESKDND